MKRFVLISLNALALFGCAKVHYTGRPMWTASAVKFDGARELADLTAERAALVKILRDDYRMDVTVAASTWSCCGVPWARYVDRDLRTIRRTLDRILVISQRQAELTGTDPRSDAEAHRTAVLSTQLGHQHRTLD